jgi:glycosyltransferase involved in cell wall biosynthesis
MQAVLDHSMGLVIGCDSFRDEVVENHGTTPSRFTIIPGATNTDQFRPRQEVLGALRQPIRLLYHGRVDSRKGSLDFIRAGRALLDRGHDVQMIVSGIGPDFDATGQLARELGVEGCTFFPGEAAYADAPERYHAGDIFLSPTYAEGFSNTILEAMACGLPIVSTTTVGVVDCIRSGENGLLVKPGDVDALTDATEQLINDAQLRHRLCETAYREVLDTYSWPVVAASIERLYIDLQRQSVTDDWQHIISVDEQVEDADLSCRFRAQPHLL